MPQHPLDYQGPNEGFNGLCGHPMAFWVQMPIPGDVQRSTLRGSLAELTLRSRKRTYAHLFLSLRTLGWEVRV